jgi:hypothetical protein
MNVPNLDIATLIGGSITIMFVAFVGLLHMLLERLTDKVRAWMVGLGGFMTEVFINLLQGPEYGVYDAIRPFLFSFITAFLFWNVSVRTMSPYLKVGAMIVIQTVYVSIGTPAWESFLLGLSNEGRTNFYIIVERMGVMNVGIIILLFVCIQLRNLGKRNRTDRA